jgi:hypothetical protein
MAVFVKLFSGLLYSTVWREDLHVKVVWITLLALCDAKGRVAASVPGLAAISAVTVDQCRDALERLKAPDPDSRTKEWEGRRIADIDGGWQVLNYLKYRDMRDEDKRKEQTKEATRRWREKGKKITKDYNDHGDRGEPRRAQEEEEGRIRTTVPSLRSGDDVPPPGVVAVEAPFQAPASPLVAQVVAWSREACDDWIARFGGTAPGGQIGKAMKPLVDRHGWTAVRAAWQSYLGQTEAEYASPTRFASTFGRWSGTTVEPAPRDMRAQTPGQFNAATLQRIQRRLEAKEAERDLGQGRIADGPVEARRVLPGETE